MLCPYLYGITPAFLDFQLCSINQRDLNRGDLVRGGRSDYGSNVCTLTQAQLSLQQKHVAVSVLSGSVSNMVASRANVKFGGIGARSSSYQQKKFVENRISAAPVSFAEFTRSQQLQQPIQHVEYDSALFSTVPRQNNFSDTYGHSRLVYQQQAGFRSTPNTQRQQYYSDVQINEMGLLHTRLPMAVNAPRLNQQIPYALTAHGLHSQSHNIGWII